MEIILLEHMDNLGNVGEIVRVKDGYARNFLLPHKKCLRATEENKVVFEARRAQLEKEISVLREKAQTLAKKIESKFVVLLRQAGEDGRLYGSVSARDVAAAITASLVEVDKSCVRVDKPVKYVGVHPLKVKLYADVVAEIRVNVARTEDEAKEAENLFLNPPAVKKTAEEEFAAATSEAAAALPVEAVFEVGVEPEVTEKVKEKKEKKAKKSKKDEA